MSQSVSESKLIPKYKSHTCGFSNLTSCLHFSAACLSLTFSSAFQVFSTSKITCTRINVCDHVCTHVCVYDHACDHVCMIMYVCMITHACMKASTYYQILRIFQDPKSPGYIYIYICMYVCMCMDACTSVSSCPPVFTFTTFAECLGSFLECMNVFMYTSIKHIHEYIHTL